MPLDRRAIRTDLGYLSRRRKPGQHPPVTQAGTGGLGAPSNPAPSGSAGLTLETGRSRPGPAAQASAGLASGPRRAPASSPKATVQDRVFPAPAFGDVRQLGEANPLVRLNARQSAIGSLLVAGVRSVAWEDTHFTTGAHHADGHKAGTPVMTPGNRPLVGFEDSSGVVSLRHVRLLRRALFIAAEKPLTIGVFDGGAAAVAPRNDDGFRTVLHLSRIGAILEVRTEFVPADASDAAVWALFGFTMTIPLDQRVLLR
ncbi:hypothetical protein [Pseudarthrobacter sp. H2]|uniref:hypothetical protein n=1 Tax=Pseudarthrobacter sp. H2 TaxID=3418415 RepID=UPI003CFA1B9D